MRSRILAVTVLMTAGLAACSHNMRVVSADANTVQIHYSGSGLEDATERAQKFCLQYGRYAQLRQTLPDTRGEQIATFDCIAR